MTCYVSSDRLDRLGAALRVVLKPAGEGGMKQWFADVLDVTCGLVEADVGSVVDARAGGRVLHSTADSSLVHAYESYYWMHDLGAREILRRRLEVGHLGLVDRIDERACTEFYTDYVVPNGLKDTMSLNTFTADGPALRIILTYFHGPLDSPDVERNEALLRALAPAFRAAVSALDGWMAGAARLGRVIDGLSDALAICTSDGRVAHRNPALADLVAADPEGQRLEEAIRAAALDLGRQITSPAAPLATLGEREVHTDAGRYTLRTTLAEEVLGPGVLVVVAVQPDTPRPVSDERLRERFQLTDREIGVARGLMKGLSNAELARQLIISPHTARHHTERVLRKLGVTKRAQVAAAIEDVDRPA